jgi:carbonic anhydrase
MLNSASYLAAAMSRSVRSIIDSLLAPVNAAAAALAATHGPAVTGMAGYRTAVIEVAVALNAALTAMTLARTLAQDNPAAVVFSVYDLSRRRVGLPVLHDSEVWQGGLFAPPEDDAGFQELGRHLAAGSYITSLLS